ncbi:MAG TPA: phosphopentomutase [Vicinamibacterales bacterium]|nr:phosphopentomutase [Vicinamibacterales bacterium]
MSPKAEVSPTRPDRVILIVMDSVGIGELPDAATYGDEGSNTLGNIAKVIPLKVPALRSLGLDRVVDIGAPAPPATDVAPEAPLGAFGRMAQQSPGKDSVTGHWEIAGLVLERPFPTFPQGFPQEMLSEFERRIGRTSLANKAASGTAIIDELGEQHMASGQPIVYTSADSVFQIAAHEDVVPIEELYRWCEIAFEIAGTGAGVGRVIARPFKGAPGAFERTPNRRDFALTPFAPTLLDVLKDKELPVVSVGKIHDLFAGRGTTSTVHTDCDDEGMDEIAGAMEKTERGLIFANLVDFDTKFGHRNDVPGYAENLERFDCRLAVLIPALKAGDVLIVTADHGNDPTTTSTDHSREYVPVMIVGASIKKGIDLGTRATFADLGQTIAELFGAAKLPNGTSFLSDILTA